MRERGTTSSHTTLTEDGHASHHTTHDTTTDRRRKAQAQNATSPASDEITIRGEAGSLTLDAVVAVARGQAQVRLAPSALEQVRAARALVDQISAENRTVYGLTTGFGHLSSVKIAPDQLAELQRNLIRSHSAGTGDPLDVPTTRAIMLLLTNSLCRGHSGVRPVVVETLAGMLNARVTPVVPCRGSVGASGDLAPLAHVTLALIGEGEAFLGGERLPAGEALRRAGLEPVALAAKEGLALINGTHVMEACAILAFDDARRLVRAAEVVAAMSTEALLGSYVPLDARIHALRPQPGQGVTAARMRALLDGSEINPSHADCGRVQDPYTVRCVPQVLGAARDTLTYCEHVFSAELDAVTDNPLIFPEDGEVLTGGNFHGQPLALALDFLAIALAQVTSFSERRTYSLMGPHDWDTGDHAMPLFLTPEPGLNSGYMIAQYAAAAMTNEVTVLANPASTHSIPTSAGMEDFVSMGMTSALKLRQMMPLTYRVVAIEALCAAQGLEFRKPLRPGQGVAAAVSALREVVAPLGADRPPSPDIEATAQALAGGLFDALAPEGTLATAPKQADHDGHANTSANTSASSAASSRKGRRANGATANGATGANSTTEADESSADRGGRGRH